MTLSTVTNATVDAAAALVPAPFGPLTRVSDFETFPTPNSNIKGQFTSALSLTVYLTYEELADTVLYTPLLEVAHSTRAINAQLETLQVVALAVALNLKADAMPYPDTQWQAAVDALRTIRPMVAQQVNFDERYASKKLLKADFTEVHGAGTFNVDGTPSTGNIIYYVWDYGNGTYAVGKNPAAVTGLSAGTYTVTLYVVGPAGWAKKSVDITVT